MSVFASIATSAINDARKRKSSGMSSTLESTSPEPYAAEATVMIYDERNPTAYAISEIPREEADGGLEDAIMPPAKRARIQ